jgi:hypothetical protein
MKTYNNHPQWYNEPIRLTEEQTNNPTLIFFYEQIEILVEGVWVLRRGKKATIPGCNEPCVEEVQAAHYTRVWDC